MKWRIDIMERNMKKKNIEKAVYVFKITTGSTRQFACSFSIADLKIELSHKKEKETLTRNRS
jgi:hypothetical protein